jgi:hypothetical protein
MGKQVHERNLAIGAIRHEDWYPIFFEQVVHNLCSFISPNSIFRLDSIEILSQALFDVKVKADLFYLVNADTLSTIPQLLRQGCFLRRIHGLATPLVLPAGHPRFPSCFCPIGHDFVLHVAMVSRLRNEVK